MKKDIPFNSSAKTVDKQIALDLHVRTAQWQMFVVGQDRWKAFCNAFPVFKSYLSGVGGEDIPPDVVKAARKELVVEAEPGMTQPLDCDVAVSECLDESEELLGDKDPRVPEDVHRRMLELAEAGAIARTSLQQRQRAAGTLGTTYAVPKWLTEARAVGYVSPNLQAPAGYRWVPKPNKSWVLEVKAGERNVCNSSPNKTTRVHYHHHRPTNQGLTDHQGPPPNHHHHLPGSD